jgi:ABC-2 type transport system permease protein
MGALVTAGFRRYSTYRQATFAGAMTNTVFGFLRTYVLLAVAAGAGGVAAGYDREQLITFIWVGQGLIAVVLLWGWTDLADRVRTGDVSTDLLRPVHPVAQYLGIDLGRAGFMLLFRLVPPVLVGSLAFGLLLPRRWTTYPAIVASAFLAVVVSFAARYLLNSAAYWLMDLRGVNAFYTVGTGVLSGLYFPLRFLPGWAMAALTYGTPFPSVLQTPLDVYVERVDTPGQVGLIAVQLAWAVGLLALCGYVQRRAELKLVIQGG